MFDDIDMIFYSEELDDDGYEALKKTIETDCSMNTNMVV